MLRERQNTSNNNHSRTNSANNNNQQQYNYNFDGNNNRDTHNNINSNPSSVSHVTTAAPGAASLSGINAPSTSSSSSPPLTPQPLTAVAMGNWDNTRTPGCFMGYSAWFWAGIIALIIGGIGMPLYLATASDTIRHIPLFLGTYCAILSALLSFLHILEHLSLFAEPDCQMKVVRVVFMAPLYALCSCLGLWIPSIAPNLDLLRDAYESYAIYAFFSLMIAQCGGYDTIYRSLMVEQRPPVQHVFPLCHFAPMRVTPRFVQRCRLGMFQFMIAKPLITLTVLVLESTDSLGNVLDPKKGNFWCMLMYNITLTVALYALVYLYFGLREFLEGKNALAKFLCFKAVVFLSYWQGLMIAILVALNWMPTYKGSLWETDEEAHEGLQRMLICIEMLVISLSHKIAFGTSEFTKHAVLVDDWSQVSVTTTTVDESSSNNNVPSIIINASTSAQSDNSNNHGNDDADERDTATILPSLRPRPRNVTFVPPARRDIWSNLKMTLKQPDIIADIRDICRGA